ncbi:MAG: DUF418 domain-containing protein [Aquincola tertiaricarbonis]|uniref:DUF418 domain-containing protein n=1 Tax=Aquincola sp. J276 TaxID=2898432 RepID=UPI00215104AB|nr:DUF418 domain-containing protein [Aquincola sp. J276]MCR5866854.1 DUF418 domain-containing protein [Aquincola sp. J276]
MTSPTHRRDPLLDALRALAMVGVLVVNAISYTVGPWGAPLGEADPASMLSLGLQSLTALLLHGKAYPLLAFLFGAGLVLASRRATLQDRRRRLWRLLGLGVLHGALVYAGDILTMYALCGFTVVAHARERLSRLHARWLRACGWALGSVALSVMLTLLAGGSAQADASEGFGATASWRDQFVLNLNAYLMLQVLGLVLFLPVLRAAMLAGMLAARLRLLTHRRWRPVWQRWVRRLLPVGLLANAAYAFSITDAAARGDSALSLWTAVAPGIGWMLTVPLVGLVVLHARRWPQALAPLGQRTLSLYLLHSLGCLALFSGAGLGWPLPPLAAWTWAMGLWWLAIPAARAMARQGWRGPFEAWMGRR